MTGIDWNNFFNGLLLFVLGVLGFFGVKGGLREAKQPKAEDRPATVEFAGTMVDSSSIALLAGSIEGHSLALAETRSLGREMVKAVDHLAEAVNDHRDEVRELRHEMSRRR